MQSGQMGLPQSLHRTRVSRARWFAQGTGSPGGMSSQGRRGEGTCVTGSAGGRRG